MRAAVVLLAGLSLGAGPASELAHATLLAHRTEPLPRNTHLFVRERWRSMLPPASAFVLRKQGSSGEIPLEHRIQPIEDGRLNELVPATDLEANTTYELTLNAQSNTQTFTVRVGDAIDRAAPEWDGTRSGARDDSGLGPLYVVWRQGTDGLVDVDALPTDVVTSLEGLGAEGYVAVQVVDFAGHRLEPREIALGGPLEDPTLRRTRLAMKRGTAMLRENSTAVMVGFVIVALTVYLIVKARRHFA